MPGLAMRWLPCGPMGHPPVALVPHLSIRKLVFCVLRSGTSATRFVAERMPHCGQNASHCGQNASLQVQTLLEDLLSQVKWAERLSSKSSPSLPSSEANWHLEHGLQCTGHPTGGANEQTKEEVKRQRERTDREGRAGGSWKAVKFFSVYFGTWVFLASLSLESLK